MPSRRIILVALAGFAALYAVVAAADGEESGPELAQRMRDFFFEITPAEAEISPSASLRHCHRLADPRSHGHYHRLC
jgi:hypothetical protein